MSGPTEVDGSPALPSPDRGSAPSGPPVDRAAALAEGAPGIPTKFVFWSLGVVLVVALGGLIGEHLFSSAGLNPVATTVPRPVAPTPAPAAPAPVPDRSINASLEEFMGLSTPVPHPAPRFNLTDQAGQVVSLPVQPARVVVLTFFNAQCNDICPVVGAEIQQAESDLGSASSEVDFVTVNTDPSALAQSAAGPVLSRTGLGHVPDWSMVTGPLSALNQVWKDYGVSISVDEKTGLEAHNDVMDFIDAQGELRYRATPFADESSTGTFSLPAPSVARWAQGIASYAERLVAR